MNICSSVYKGQHDRVVAYGSIGIDGRQFIRTYDKFDKETVLQYLKDLVRHFRKVAIIMDNAPQHRAKTINKFLKGNKNVVIPTNNGPQNSQHHATKGSRSWQAWHTT